MSRLASIISVGLLILVIVGGYFFWLPKYQEFKDKKLELERKTAEVQKKEEFFSKLKTLSEKLKEYPDELSKIDSALPKEHSMPSLFNFIQQVSSENGLILTNISASGAPLLKTTEERIQRIPFAVSLLGSYPAFKNFLSTVYKNVRLIEINSISFSSPKEKDLFNFDLSMEAHAYRELKEGEEEQPSQK